jgi:hypothetical protein
VAELQLRRKISLQNSFKVYEVTPSTENDVDFLHSLANNEDFDFWSLRRTSGVASTVMVKPGSQDWFEESLRGRAIPFVITIDDLET